MIFIVLGVVIYLFWKAWVWAIGGIAEELKKF